MRTAVRSLPLKRLRSTRPGDARHDPATRCTARTSSRSRPRRRRARSGPTGRRPVGDPQHRVAVVREPGRVAHVVLPEVRRAVDHRVDPEPLVDSIEPGTDPGVQGGRRQPAAPLEIEDRDQVARRRRRGVDEMVRLGARVAGARVGLREVIGTDDEPGRGRARPVGRVHRCRRSRCPRSPSCRLNDLPGRGDGEPVDRVLPVADVEAFERAGRGRLGRRRQRACARPASSTRRRRS